MNTKPLGQKAYGSIPHLPGSRRGPADKGLSDDQARILTERASDGHDHIIVQEKLDGSCVAVARLNGQILPLIRAGYHARSSPFEMHWHFADWVSENLRRFEDVLSEGERCVGEWLMQAHGTLYKLPHEPFVIFDIITGYVRALYAPMKARCASQNFVTPRVLHVGEPISIEKVLTMLEPSGHDAIDGVEGAVWRVERKNTVDFLGKFVRMSKVDGKYLESVSGKPPIYNWTPKNENWQTANPGNGQILEQGE